MSALKSIDHAKLSAPMRLALATGDCVTLAAEVVRLQADARRYQWLRSQPDNTDAPRIDVVHWTPGDVSTNDGEGLRMEALDAAIDAALTAQSQEGA